MKTACKYWTEGSFEDTSCDGTQCDTCKEFNKYEEEEE